MLILMVLHFKKNTKITDRKLLMCAMYVFRSLYLNFGHGTHHIHIIVHVAVFNFLLQFEIAMFDSFYSFFTCARMCTSEFLRHTTISLIKFFKGWISVYIVQSTSCFWQSFPHLFDYFISLPLILKSVQLISASYPWF